MDNVKFSAVFSLGLSTNDVPFFSIFQTPKNEMITTHTHPIPSRKDWSFAERLTKKGKVKWAIYKFYSFKSAGLDGIFPALLKEGLEVLLARLTSIFKSSIALGYSTFPNSGKRSEWFLSLNPAGLPMV